MVSKAKAASFVNSLTPEQLDVVESAMDSGAAIGEMLDTLTTEVDAELLARREKHQAYHARLQKLNLDTLGDAFESGVAADRAARKSWQYLGDMLIMRDYRSTDIFTPTKDTPATEELLAIKSALIKYGYPDDVRAAIALPARQRVVLGDDIRAKVKVALEDEVPRFLRAIKKAMAASEDRGPKALVRTLREQLQDDIETWLKTLRKADESKLDFNVVDAIGALKDVISVLDGEV